MGNDYTTSDIKVAFDGAGWYWAVERDDEGGEISLGWCWTPGDLMSACDEIVSQGGTLHGWDVRLDEQGVEVDVTMMKITKKGQAEFDVRLEFGGVKIGDGSVSLVQNPRSGEWIPSGDSLDRWAGGVVAQLRRDDRDAVLDACCELLTAGW